MSRSFVRFTPKLLPVVAVLWLGAMAGSTALLWKYALTPGIPSGPLPQWPAESKLRLSTEAPTLLVFVHPHCPCSRATLHELALTLASCPAKIETQVVFYRPVGFGPGWEKTSLWRKAEDIPGVKVVIDQDGAELKIFSVTTSGQVLLYDRSGKLQYNGGITAARGHEGQNAGRDAIISVINGSEMCPTASPVFGCPLSETAAFAR
ncbi:MAG: RedB protein [Planctomycetota bacterium]|nr:RedB protein [Planctomycetota bacterium]